MSEIKFLTEETLADAESVVRQCFPAEALSVLAKVMRNPLRQKFREVGCIGYEDGVPVCMQARIHRLAYFGRESIYASVGGMTSVVPGAPLESFIDVRAEGNRNVIGHKIKFSNTLCKATEQMVLREKKHLGISSCCRYKFAVLRPLKFAWYCFRRKVLRIPLKVAKSFNLNFSPFSLDVNGCQVVRLDRFDERLGDFWARYVEQNEGLVSSRSLEELSWLFGNEMACGRIAFLVACQEGEISGYIILRDERGSGERWLVEDWIAIGNDTKILDALLYSGKKFLYKKTPAMILESIGFPSFVQSIVQRHLPWRRATENNFFCYSYWKPKKEGKEFAEKCEAVINTPKSWFFGPYDGDMCM